MLCFLIKTEKRNNFYITKVKHETKNISIRTSIMCINKNQTNVSFHTFFQID